MTTYSVTHLRDVTNNARSSLQAVKYIDVRVPNKIAILASSSGSKIFAF
jgi:hypothetical protein